MIAGAPLLLALLAAGGLRVETGSPEALCPDLGQVREAARARLGDIEAEGEWLASYTLVHRPDAKEGGDVVRLELTDPAGRLRLRRDLVRAGESCAALARALVVVLDAYFRHPAQAEDGARAEEAAVVTATATAATTTTTASAPPASMRLALDLSGGWSGGWAGGSDPHSALIALGLRLAVVPGPPTWWGGLEGAWMLSRPAETIGEESATLRSFGLRGFLARDLARTDRVALLAGPELMLELDQADAASLLDGAKKMRASWGAGARAQLELRLARRAFISFRAAFDYAPAAWGGTFLVAAPDGGPANTREIFREIFPTARYRLLLGAGLGLAVF